jgi:hypothetical protein
MGFGFTEHSKWGKNSGLKNDFHQYSTSFITKGNKEYKGYQGYKAKNFDNVR